MVNDVVQANVGLSNDRQQSESNAHLDLPYCRAKICLKPNTFVRDLVGDCSSAATIHAKSSATKVLVGAVGKPSLTK